MDQVYSQAFRALSTSDLLSGTTADALQLCRDDFRVHTPWREILPILQPLIGVDLLALTLDTHGECSLTTLQEVLQRYPRLEKLEMNGLKTPVDMRILQSLVRSVRRGASKLEILSLPLEVVIGKKVRDDPHLQGANWSPGTIKELTLFIHTSTELRFNLSFGLFKIARTLAGLLASDGAIKVHLEDRYGRTACTPRMDYLFTTCVLWLQRYVLA